MRTTVYTNPSDPDEVDNFPECFGAVDEDGSLTIVYFHDSAVETIYAPGEWSAYTVDAD